MALSHLALTLSLLAPQGADEVDPRVTTALSASEHKKLNDLAKKWFEARKKWEDETDPNKRVRLAQKRSKAREKFMNEWDKKEKKEPLKHVGDLLAVFENVFPYPRQSGTGQIKFEKQDEGSFDVVVPRGYKESEAYTTLVVLPSRDGDSWTANNSHFDATWKGVDAAGGYLYVMPRIEDSLELDPIPDLSSTAGDALEKDRIRAVLMAVGRAQQMYRFDRNRLILDASKGNCGFAMRLASYFPTRFAGLILRDPVEFGSDDEGALREHFQYGGIGGMPVALVKGDGNGDVCDRIAKRLNDLAAGSCEILESGDEVAPKLAEWVGKVRRDLFRKTVVLEPNHDLFRKGYWVQIDRCEPVHSGAEGRPYLKAEADRDANRITITARNVASFQILLNDAIVDLDKDFTVVVNGKAVTERVQRSFHKMTEFLSFSLFDPNRVWTATYRTTVPDSE